MRSIIVALGAYMPGKNCADETGDSIEEQGVSMKNFSWIFCCVLALTTTVYASDDQTANESDTSELELEEVIVLGTRTRVATKTDAALMEVPQSISIVTAEKFTDFGALNYQDVFRYSAGVATEAFGEDVRSDAFSARGFALKQYLDGLNKTPDYLYGSRTEVFTLERAEVLRGPSAVLYGAGSAGGLLNAVSKRPQFEFGGEIGLRVGNFKRKEVMVDVTGPMSENFAGRFVGVARDGELLSPGQKNDKYVLMPSVTWRLGDNTELTFIGLYQKEDLGTQTYVPARKTLFASAEDPAIPHDFFMGEPGFNHMKSDQYSGTILFDHRFNDNISFTSNTRYIDQTVDYAEVYLSTDNPWVDPERTLNIRQFYVLEEDYQIFNTDNNVQFNFNTGSMSHTLVVGIDYTEFEQDRQEGFSCLNWPYPPCWSSSPPPLDVYNPDYGQPFDYGFTNAYETRSTQLGIYLQDQIRFGERVSVVLGVRRDDSSSEATLSPKETSDATTYKIGVIAEIVDGVSPFISYAEGFTPVFGGDFYGMPYDPQESHQYELGIKWQPNPSSLFTASYFDIEETNFLTQDPNNIQNFIQSGVVGSKGFELEGNISFANDFGLIASYSYTKAEVLEGTSDHPAGDRVEDLPEKLASAWLDKGFIINDDLSWRIGGGVRYIGDKIDFLQILETPSVTLVDAMAEVTFREHWKFALNITNLTDKEWYATCSAPFGTRELPDGHCYVGYTRTVLFSIRRAF